MPTCNGSVRWKYTLGLLLKVGSTLVYTLPSSGRTITPAHNITLSVYPAYLLILCHRYSSCTKTAYSYTNLISIIIIYSFLIEIENVK